MGEKQAETEDSASAAAPVAQLEVAKTLMPSRPFFRPGKTRGDRAQGAYD